MNTNERNKMSMYRAVDAVFKRYKITVNATEPLARAVAHYRKSIAVILQRDKEYCNITGKMASTRNSAIENVVERALQCANALYALGRRYDIRLLKTECRITEIDLNCCSDNELEHRCIRLNELAREYATEIAVFEFDRETFQSAIESFGRQAGSQRIKIEEAKIAHEKLYQSFEATDGILEDELDTIIELMKSKNIDLYRKYQSARIVHDLGGHMVKKNRRESIDPFEWMRAADPVTV